MLVGNASVKKRLDREGAVKNLLREIADVMYRDEDKLSATGRERHEISLVGDSPV